MSPEGYMGDRPIFSNKPIFQYGTDPNAGYAQMNAMRPQQSHGYLGNTQGASGMDWKQMIMAALQGMVPGAGLASALGQAAQQPNRNKGALQAGGMGAGVGNRTPYSGGIDFSFSNRGY